MPSLSLFLLTQSDFDLLGGTHRILIKQWVGVGVYKSGVCNTPPHIIPRQPAGIACQNLSTMPGENCENYAICRMGGFGRFYSGGRLSRHFSLPLLLKLVVRPSIHSLFLHLIRAKMQPSVSCQKLSSLSHVSNSVFSRFALSSPLSLFTLILERRKKI